MNRTFWLAALILTAFASTNLSAATWSVDPAHTNVGFSVKHMMVSTVHGSFNTFSGTATFDEKAPATVAMEGTIDATSITTNNERRDGHLKSPDFFDVANFPTITFKSTKSEMSAPGKYKVTGDLTMHGITKPIVMDMEGFTDFVAGPKGGSRTGASLTATINRHDFGLNWNKALEAGGVMVSDSVKITLDLELEKAGDVSTK
ncbi:MAG TPA: YceI family protein [bacterium]|jgi:polyisoprenoid-binding protein YceI